MSLLWCRGAWCRDRRQRPEIPWWPAQPVRLYRRRLTTGPVTSTVGLLTTTTVRVVAFISVVLDPSHITVCSLNVVAFTSKSQKFGLFENFLWDKPWDQMNQSACASSTRKVKVTKMLRSRLRLRLRSSLCMLLMLFTLFRGSGHVWTNERTDTNRETAERDISGSGHKDWKTRRYCLVQKQAILVVFNVNP